MKKILAFFLSVTLLLTSLGMTAIVSAAPVGQVTNLASGLTGYELNLVEGFGVGTQRWTNYTSDMIWADLDGLTFDSANCYYIQTNSEASSVSGYQSTDTEGLITFNINKSANVYILYGGGTWIGGSGPMPGLKTSAGWEMLKKSDDTPYLISTSGWTGDASGAWQKARRAAYVIKKTYEVEAGTTTNVSLTYGGAGCTAGYNVVVEFIDEPVSNLTSGIEGYPMNLVKGFGVGTKRWTNSNSYNWANFDGLTFDSENCYYIQTDSEAKDISGYKASTTEGLIEFDIHRSANVYILYGGGTWIGDPQYLPGLTAVNGWEMLKKSDNTPYLIYTEEWETLPDDNTGKNSAWYKARRAAYVIKKSFPLAEGATQHISLTYGGTSCTAGYSVVVEFADSANLTVSSTGSGTVSPSGTVPVIIGSTQTITATPADGWEVESVKINGVDSVASESFSVTVNADTTVEVTFAEIPVTEPIIAQTYATPFTSKDDVTINGNTISGPKGILFAKVADTTGYTLEDYGMEFALTQTDLTDGKGIEYSALGKKSTLGNYGVCFYGSFAAGTEYYARPYATYKKIEDGTTIKVVGAVIPFTPNTVN